MPKKLINHYNIIPNKKKLVKKKFIIIFLVENLFIILIIIMKANKRIILDKKLLEEFLSFQNKTFIKKEIIPDYNYSFAIIKRNNCSNGLFGFYVAYLGCINKYINDGYIPILDLSSFPNLFNGFNVSTINENPWELFFNQPFDYKLKNIIKFAKKKKYIYCNPKNRPDTNIYKNKLLISFWHNLAEKYIPIKKEIIKESNDIRNNLFKGSLNVLGILIRGTDYISMKPRGHPIQPNPNIVINDTIMMDNKNKYDWIFLTTEDELIRQQFILEFRNKLKFIKPKNIIKYNYNNKDYLAFNNIIKGNIDYMKMYLINIIILSKCIDIICSRTAGSVGAFILSKGFRNIKVYYLGRYK